MVLRPGFYHLFDLARAMSVNDAHDRSATIALIMNKLGELVFSGQGRESMKIEGGDISMFGEPQQLLLLSTNSARLRGFLFLRTPFHASILRVLAGFAKTSV